MKVATALAAILSATPSAAGVLSSNATGFHLRHNVTVRVPPGFASGGADKLAPLVDKVLSDQWTRYAAATGAR